MHQLNISFYYISILLGNCSDRIMQGIDVNIGCILFLAWKGGFPLSSNCTYAHAREFNWLYAGKIKYSKFMRKKLNVA